MLVLAIPGLPRDTYGQAIAAELGGAAIHHFESTGFSYGASLYWSHGDRLTSSVTYLRWTGEDSLQSAPDATGTFAGDRSLTAAAWYDLLPSDPVDLRPGIGLAAYERELLIEGFQVGSEVNVAITVGAMARRALGEEIGTFLRIELAAPAFRIEPRWGFARLGVDFAL